MQVSPDVLTGRLHRLVHEVEIYKLLERRKTVLLIYIFLIVLYVGLNFSSYGN